MMTVTLSGILQTCGAAMLCWAAKMLLDANRLLAVHAEKHNRTDKRLEKLEEKVC